MKETYWNREGGNPGGISGGQKRMWLRQHREEVLRYLKENGEETTCKYFHLHQFTLEQFLASEAEPLKDSFSKADRALARVDVMDAGLMELRRELRDLKEAFALFQDTVSTQLTEKFFKPLLERAIQPGPELEVRTAKDPLLLSNLGVSKPFDIINEASKVVTQYKKDSEARKAGRKGR